MSFGGGAAPVFSITGYDYDFGDGDLGNNLLDKINKFPIILKITMGVMLGLAMIIVCCCVRRCCRNSKQKKSSSNGPNGNEQGLTIDLTASGSTGGGNSTRGPTGVSSTRGPTKNIAKSMKGQIEEV